MLRPKLMSDAEWKAEGEALREERLQADREDAGLAPFKPRPLGDVEAEEPQTKDEGDGEPLSPEEEAFEEALFARRYETNQTYFARSLEILHEDGPWDDEDCD